MGLRVRTDGSIVCAAMHEAMPGDVYLHDGILGELSGSGAIVATATHLHAEGCPGDYACRGAIISASGYPVCGDGLWERGATPDRSGAPRTVADVLTRWSPGSGDWPWSEEIEDLIRRDGPALSALMASITKHGLRAADPTEEPITLGDDGRVWGGHHRLVAAWLVNPQTVLPVGVEFGRDFRGTT